MLDKQKLQKIIADYHSKPPKKLIERDLSLPEDINKIVTVIGPRRSGKTATIEHMAETLRVNGLKNSQILYLNFEDERLVLNSDDLDTILQVYAEMYPAQDLANCYFMFDEIQNINGWEKFVRRLYDTVSSHVYITGSNSKLLSTEIATELRGRTLTFELLPLSFNEYLRFKKIDSTLETTANHAKIQTAFRDFMKYGGFPEIALLPEEYHKNILQDYFNVMIYRDMIERYQFGNVHVLKYFLKRMFESVGKPFSVNKVFNDLKSQNYNIGKNKLYQFLDAANTIYMCAGVHKYSQSVLKQELSEKKYYAIDIGLLQALTFEFSNDFGSILENTVILELLKRGHKLFYFKDKKECDIIIQNNDGTLTP
ncbi:MAG: ATP-binding protein, partial [Bacteroidota bacterium]|nr:ATP-binding protein [Bacteroidota bacterium]